ncbi:MULTISPECIES: hypothetical protein [unclassified Diaminobutyricimonas]|uniref:hypothetical protein n=1 Tax=unclassified Diaminobutyricimonas TaxID=2643261 RepID=UPI0012F4A4E7|nr:MULTISPECIES: hypothetical protein [unclassified Diaminobutyricimonas]
MSDDERALLLGADSPLDILDLSIKPNETDDGIVTLALGRDSVESGRVSFRLTSQDAETIHHWIVRRQHTHAGADSE